MSRNFVLKTIAIIAVVASVGFLEKPQGRNLKNQSLQIKRDLIVKTAKLKPTYEVKISRLNDDGSSAEEAQQITSPFTLVAEISTDKILNDLNYTWVLPEGVVPASGDSLSGSLAQVTPKSSTTLKIRLVQKDSFTGNEIIDNKKIHIKLWPADNNDPQFASAQFNTVLQKKIETEKHELSLRNTEYISGKLHEIKTHK